MAINSLQYQSRGLSGLASGQDTEAMVQKMLMGTQTRIDTQWQKRTTLEYKRDAYREIAAKLKTLQTDYFSFTKPENNLMSESLFNSMKASTTSSAYGVTAGPTAKPGKVTIDEISQLATSTTVKSAGTVSGTLTGTIDLEALKRAADAAKNKSFILQVGGDEVTIDVKSLAGLSDKDVADRLNIKLEKAYGIRAEYKNGDVVLTSTRVGDKNNELRDFTIITGDPAMNQLLGITGAGKKSDKGSMILENVDSSALSPSFEVTLDGGQKRIINFEVGDTEEKTIANINAALKKAVGNSVRAVAGQDGKTISFETNPGSQVTLTGLALGGLGFKNGASNKINLTADLNNSNLQGLNKDANQFSFTINGEQFTFSNIASISEIMNKVNRSSANVTMSYSSIEDKFTIQSKVSGEGGQVDMSEQEGNLLTAMFGSAGYAATPGNEAQGAIVPLFGEQKGDTNGTTTKLEDLGIKNGDKVVFQDANGNKFEKTIWNVDGKKVKDIEFLVTEGKKEGQNKDFLAANQDFNVVQLTDTEKAEYTAKNLPLPAFRVVGVDVPIRFYVAGQDGKEKTENVKPVQMQPAGQGFGVRSEGQNAKLSINGQAVERNSNNFTFEGLTFDLRSTTKESSAVSTTRDTTNSFESIKKFVTAYNETNKFMYEQLTAEAKYREYPPLTNAQKDAMTDKEIELWEAEAKKGLLRSDSTVSTIQNKMRTGLYQKSSTSDLALYDIGVQTSFYTEVPGELVLDETKLKQMLSDDPEAVMNLFTDATDGLATRMNDIIGDAVRVSSTRPGTLYQMAGAAGTKDTSSTIYRQIKEINSNLERLEDRYDMEYNRYWKQFNNMESVLANLSQQSMWLMNQFSGMQG